MAKPTKTQLNQMVDELLTIAAIYDRYRLLEKQVKEGMDTLDLTEIEVAGKGRVFISESVRTTIPVEVAVDVLGQKLARKITQVKRSISKRLFDAFCEAGEIEDALQEAVLERSEHRRAVSLYVRPLN